MGIIRNIFFNFVIFGGVATIFGIGLVSRGKYDVAHSLCQPRGEYLSVLEEYPTGPMQYCVFSSHFRVLYSRKSPLAKSGIFVKSQSDNKGGSIRGDQ